MARRSAPGTLIHCDYCGEEYSATYKRCPFCGEKPAPGAPAESKSAQKENAPEDDYVFEGGDVFDRPAEEDDYEDIVDRSKGGKRLGDDARPVNWSRMITFVCSLVIIAAALVIVFTKIFPNVREAGKDSQGSGGSSSSGQSESTPTPPAQTTPVQPSDEPTDQPSDEPTDEPTSEPTQVPSEVVLGIKYRSKADFTLTPDESYTVSVVIDPAAWSGAVSWSTTEPTLVKLEDKGMVKDTDGTVTYQCVVTNTNSGTKMLSATVTAAAGDQTADAKVYCRPGSTPDTSGNTVASGTTGTITGVSNGLRVRSGPGTSYDKVASLRSGNKVTVLEDAGDGWYKIDYGNGTGYIMGQYIKFD